MGIVDCRQERECVRRLRERRTGMINCGIEILQGRPRPNRVRAPNSAHALGGQDVGKHVREDGRRRRVVADEVWWSAHRVAASS
jgi:hypothetical protein